ncbi:unnamed protein product [Linum trigynum]|uniref:Uncharacterized protein n=1 Tax=Linum trigynum TaxID=586398 RepID=A0AAV2FLG2_9ROSI
MGCGASKFDAHEGAAAGAQQTHHHDVDSPHPPPAATDEGAGDAGARKSSVTSASRLRGLRKIKEEVHAIRRHHHHHHHHHHEVDKLLLPPPPPAKDGGRMVVVVKKAAAGEVGKDECGGGGRGGGEGHREDSIMVSLGSPSFRVYCVDDDLLPHKVVDDHHHRDSQPRDDHEVNMDDEEKENKVPVEDGSNKGEEGKRNKKGKRGRGIMSVLPRGGGSGGMRHILHPHRLGNHSNQPH